MFILIMESRDWWMLGMGFGIGFFVFTTIGREVAMSGMGLGKAEIERVIAKADKRAEQRAKID